MRIIGEIEHSNLKITVFQHDSRISIKFETGMYEQTYKFRTGGLVNDLEEAKTFVDAEVIAQVILQFEQMHKLKTNRLGEMHQESEEFDEII